MTLTADELFKIQYRGPRNIFTPHIIERGKAGPNRAWELSSGEGIVSGNTLYGVSVVEYDPNTETTSSSRLSEAFGSLEEATEYIREIGGRI